jgi:hypothetical protein
MDETDPVGGAEIFQVRRQQLQVGRCAVRFDAM